MANRNFSNVSPAPKGRAMAPPAHPGGGGKAKMPMKPAFPSAKLPGKTGPERSAGTRKAKQHPKSLGL